MKNAYLSGLVGGIQSIIISMIAMFFYAGGHANDSLASGYTFWANFFSDLGMTVAYSGKPNTVSLVMFDLMLVVWAIATAIFFILLPSLLKKSKRAQFLGITGSIIAVIHSVSCIGVVFTPLDTAQAGHYLFAQYLYLTIMLAFFLYVVAILWDKGFPNKYALSMLLGAILLLAFIALVLVGPGLQDPEWLVIYVIAQKIATYAAWIVVGYVSYGAWKLAD